MICPECSQPMQSVPCQTPINYSGIGWERWHCEECQLGAKVETSFYHEEISPVSITERT